MQLILHFYAIDMKIIFDHCHSVRVILSFSTKTEQKAKTETIKQLNKLLLKIKNKKTITKRITKIKYLSISTVLTHYIYAIGWCHRHSSILNELEQRLLFVKSFAQRTETLDVKLKIK